MDNVQNNICRRMFTIISALNDMNTYIFSYVFRVKTWIKSWIYIYPLSIQTHFPVKELEYLLAPWNPLLLVHHPLKEQEE